MVNRYYKVVTSYGIVSRSLNNRKDVSRFAIGMIMFIFLAESAGAVTLINSCTTISSPGEYALNADIIDSTLDPCIRINSSDVIFDGQYHTLDRQRDGFGYGVSVFNPAMTLTNVTVKNLTVTDWWYGLSYRYVQNGVIENINASSNVNGFTLDNSDDNVLTGNMVLNNTWGIQLYFSINNSLRGNNASYNMDGIELGHFSNNNTLDGNTFLNNTDNGIYLLSNNNTLVNNYASDNRIGIELESGAKNNVLDGNTILNSSEIGINLLYSCNNNTITNNNLSMNAAGIYSWYSGNNKLNGNNISNNSGNGIYLGYSNSSTLSGNIVLYNGQGIELQQSSNNTLIDNRASYNKGFDGLDLEFSSNNNTLLNNNFSNNKLDGIEILLSSKNTLDGNIVLDNYIGIYLTDSSDNTIYNNYFNNSNNTYFYGTNRNTWNIPRTAGTNILGNPYLGGNVWANPQGTGFSQTCSDSNGDGICDLSNILVSENIDYLPLALSPGLIKMLAPGQIYTPAGNGWITQFTISNYDTSIRTVSIDFTNSTGSVVHTITDDAIPSLGFKRYNWSDIYALTGASSGTATVKSSNGNISVITAQRIANDTSAGRLGFFDTIQNDLFRMDYSVPGQVYTPGGAGWRTNFKITNIAGSSARVNVYYYRDDGSSITSESFTLPVSGEIIKEWKTMSDTYRVASGTARVTSDSAVIIRPAQAADFEGGLGFWSGYAYDGTNTKFYIPELVYLNDTAGTRGNFKLTNLGGSTATVTITYLNPDGSTIRTRTDTLSSGVNRLYAWKTDVYDIYGITEGSAIVESAQKLAVVAARARDTGADADYYKGIPVNADETRVFAYGLKYMGNDSSNVTISNMADASGSVTLRFLDNNGNQIRIFSNTLNGRAMARYSWKEQIIDQGINVPEGSVEITSDRKIAVLVGNNLISSQGRLGYFGGEAI